MDGGELLITVAAKGSPGCEAEMGGGELHRFGVAATGLNGCTLTWIPGYAQWYLFN
jgi:hypothetical protein